MAIIAAEQHQLILDAFDESDDVLRIARRLLSNRHNRPEVRRTVALFLGDEAPDDLETMQKLYDRIVVLENNIPERRTYTTDLKDNPWASPNRPFPRHSKVHVTFARVDKPPRMNMMRERKSVKLASAKRGQIAILPIVYEDPKYSQLIRNIEPSAGLDLDDVLKCITKTLIHQKTHALLNSQHVVLRPENMPQPNIEPESFESPQISSGGCQVWGFRLCKALANSTQSKDALKNPESLAAICLFLYLLVLWPEWDLTSGRAVRRPPAAGWLKDYDLNK